MKITHLSAREILDSKGTPTVEVEVRLENGTTAVAGVPSGASTGTSEAHELRDNDLSRYEGKGVLTAVAHVNEAIAEIVVGKDATQQQEIDQLMIEADGTENKSRLGGNAILGVSLAVCRAAAAANRIELFQYLNQFYGQLTGTTPEMSIPQPMMLLLEGGKHGNWATDIQEYMVIPRAKAFSSIATQIQAGENVVHHLEKILEQKGYATSVGFEGAFAPQEISSNEEAFQLMSQAIEQAGYKLWEEMLFAVDVAASEFFEKDQYVLHSEKDKTLSTTEWTDHILKWMKTYPIWSIEDVFHEEGWEDWAAFRQQISPAVQVVGDDLLTTNVKRIEKAIGTGAANAVLVKPNQIGTLTETLQAIKVAREAGFATIISHRGGETNDDFIADLAVGVGAGQCKFGGLDRGERLAKYNRLMKIEQLLAN